MTHMNEYLPERLAANPLQAMESDSDIEAIADAVISANDLGDLFYEIESGCKRVISADGITMSWEPTALERNDGTCPRDTNGIRPEDDFCLGCYKRFAQGTAPTTRASIAVSLSRALPGREG